MRAEAIGATNNRVLRLPAASGSPGSALLGMDEAGRAGLVAWHLAEGGLFPMLAFTGRQVLSALDSRPFDLVILDLDLAHPRPESLVKSLRARSEAALLTIGDPGGGTSVLTSMGVHALLPADAPEAVIAAQGAALLGLRQPVDDSVVLWWGPLELDVARRQAYWKSRPVSFTPLQFRILAALVVARGAVVTKRDLQRLVWGSAVADDGERIAAHIRRIRAKLDEPPRPRFLLTVRGEGYRLADG